MIEITKWGMRLLVFVLIFLALSVAVIRSPQVGRLFYPFFYKEIIEQNAGEFEVDPLLVAAVIRVESRFNANAVSHRGALGLMQLMPATAEWIGPQAGFDSLSEEMILKPEVNIRLGTWYLANLSQEFNGDLNKVIAAYNGGRGQVGRWLRDGTWSGRFEDRSSIPFPETRHYLYKVRNAYQRYKDLYR